MRLGSVLYVKRSVGEGLPSQEAPSTELPSDLATALISLSPQPAALLEVLGEPVLHRVVEVLRRGQVETIFLVVDEHFRNHQAIRSLTAQRVHILSGPAQVLPSMVETAVKRCADLGSQNVIVMDTSAYLELDVNDFVQEHHKAGQKITVAYDEGGPLHTAMVNGADGDIAATWMQRSFIYPQHTARYQHRAYVNRLQTAQDLRKLAKDALQHRCRIRPNGDELQPGVWVANTAHIHPSARLAGPAYLGPNSRLRSGVMVADCSTIERNCIVERGTLVNDSTILSGTYVGVCLDLAHVVVHQNCLMDVQRNVGIEMADSLIGATSASRKNLVPGLWATVASMSGDSLRGVRSKFRSLLPKSDPAAAVVPGRIAYSPAKSWSSLKSFSSTDSTGI